MRVRGKFVQDFTNKEVPSGTVNSSNVTFTLTYAPVSTDSLTLTKNGLVQIYTTDYTLSGSTITMATAPATASTLYAIYQYKA